MLFWNPRGLKFSTLRFFHKDSKHLAIKLLLKIEYHINQLGIKFKFPPFKKAINTPNAKLKKIELISKRSENNSPPEKGLLTPIDLENWIGSVFVEKGSAF